MNLYTTGFKIYRRLMVGGISLVTLWKVMDQFQPQAKQWRVELIGGPEMPKEIIDLGKEIAKTMKIQKPEQITLFYYAGFKSQHAGNTNLPFGAVIGIPRVFMFANEEEIRANVIFCEREINWNSKAGVLIQRLMLPDESNLRFVLAHELYNVTRNLDYKEDMFVFPMWFGGTFLAGESFLRYHARRVGVIPAFGALSVICVYCLSFAAYKQITKVIRHGRIYEADKFAAQFDKRAGMGGITYLNKLIRINQVLRALHKTDRQIYTSDGDELFKMGKYPPLTKRVEKLRATMGFKKERKTPSLF